MADACAVTLSVLLAFFLRFDFSWQAVLPYKSAIAWFLPLGILFRLSALVLFRIYALSWRYVSLRDVSRIAGAVVVSSFVLAGVLFFFVIPSGPQSLIALPSVTGFPRSILLIEAVFSFAGIALVRVSKRVYLEVVRGRRSDDGMRTLIIGAGDMGEMIARDLTRQSHRQFSLVAFLDDAEAKIGSRLHGAKVIGALDALDGAIVQYDIEAIIITISSLHHSKLKNIYRIAKKRNVRSIKMVPQLYAHDRLRVDVNALEDIKMEDLIGREEVKLDYQAIEASLFGKRVLITGAAGSIGSEIAKQVCQFRPRRILLLDCDETALFHLERGLAEQFPMLRDQMRFLIGDIRDADRVHEIFERYRPDAVFHAAAYKHVPMMENNPAEAVKVNVLGTYLVANAARTFHAQKFVLISSDKAVRPTSVMGATKRVAEEICRTMNGETAFVSVRFGNVLGSRGSVLPLFLEQLAAGGPLTVTHPDMERYFMTIPEAVSLVLQASVLGHGGEVLVLDMGKRVRIMDLAEDLIRLHGLEPYKDVDIKIVGMRPGEKIREEILAAEDGTVSTAHEKILISVQNAGARLQDRDAVIAQFEAAIRPRSSGVSNAQIRDVLKECVASYTIV